MKKDIENRQDVELLINSFYSKVREDDVIARHFSHVDWSHHTPIIIDFWSMVLLGDQNYKGNPFGKHIPLRLAGADFQRWLKLFHETVDQYFSGAVADEAKNRAVNIAGIFQFKLGISSSS